MDYPFGLSLPDPGPVISSIGHGCHGGSFNFLASSASGTWPTANLAVFIPFRLGRPFQVTRCFSVNGTAVSGNIDMGIYDVAGTRLCSSGSTAQAGINSAQNLVMTAAAWLGPGVFYLAIALDNTTGTLYRVATGVASLGEALGHLQMAAAFPLPAAATFAANAQTVVPLIGASSRSFI